MKLLDLKQGSAEWLSARLGVVTASEIDALVTPLFATRKGEGVESYLCRKVCEKTLGWQADDAGSYAVEQGQIIETVCIPWYEFTYDVKVQRVGFCVGDDPRIGCSPDGFIGDDEGIEIKSPQPPNHLKYLLRGVVPPDYLAQVHFSMLVTGRKAWTFVSFSRQFEPLVIRIKRDEEIQTKLRNALDPFLVKYDELCSKFKPN
jgi:hypothetical protein